MIDIHRSEARKDIEGNSRCVLLFIVLCFVVWDSGYLSSLIDRRSRDELSTTVKAGLLIKCDLMSDDQKYTASSPVLDEIADRSGVRFRVIPRKPGDLSGSPIWIKKLFDDYGEESPCLAVSYSDGTSKVFPAPSSVSEFTVRIGAE